MKIVITNDSDNRVSTFEYDDMRIVLLGNEPRIILTEYYNGVSYMSEIPLNDIYSIKITKH